MRYANQRRSHSPDANLAMPHFAAINSTLTKSKIVLRPLFSQTQFFLASMTDL